MRVTYPPGTFCHSVSIVDEDREGPEGCHDDETFTRRGSQTWLLGPSGLEGFHLHAGSDLSSFMLRINESANVSFLFLFGFKSRYTFLPYKYYCAYFCLDNILIKFILYI